MSVTIKAVQAATKREAKEELFMSLDPDTVVSVVLALQAVKAGQIQAALKASNVKLREVADPDCSPYKTIMPRRWFVEQFKDEQFTTQQAYDRAIECGIDCTKRYVQQRIGNLMCVGFLQGHGTIAQGVYSVKQ